MIEMQFKQKAVVLTTALMVLIGVYVLGSVFSPASVRRREISTPLYASIKASIVEDITIKTQEKAVNLVKAGENWTVDIDGFFFPASVSRIENLLDQLISLKRAKVITENPDIWQSLELSGPKAQRITLHDAGGNTILDLLVGKSDPGGRGNYVRKEAGTTVILTDRSMSFYLNAEASFWSHLRLFPQDLEGRDIMRITLEMDERHYTLLQETREGRVSWIYEESDELKLSDAGVDNLANSLAGFEGTEFLPSDRVQSSATLAEITFVTIENDEYTLTVGEKAEEEDRYPVSLKRSELKYLAAEWRINSILKPLEDLLEKP